MITRREFGSVTAGSLALPVLGFAHGGQAGPVDEVKQCAVFARQALT